MMAAKMDDDDIDRDRVLREAFAVFDKDGDGQMSWVELQEALEPLGVTLSMEEAQAMIKEVDRDGDGYVDFEGRIKLQNNYIIILEIF